MFGENTPESNDYEALLKTLPDMFIKIRAELHKKIIGQDVVINQLLSAMFCRGHCLLIGVPGLAKTLLIRTLSEISDMDFNRIQFTPDMMPSDITGVEILEESDTSNHREFKFSKGPIFTQLLLADEINRTPPKTQAALLEAMQEQRVTVAGKSYHLESPFFVLATQNPIEQEGTYPLPEAQLDRFMFSLNVGYPKFEEEVEILQRTTRDEVSEMSHVLTKEEIIAYQAAIRQIPVPASVAEFAVKLVCASRPTGKDILPVVKKYVQWGAGPRASQYLALAGKVFAALSGRFNVSVDDIKNAAHPVLRHRILLNYHAEADHMSVDDVINEILKAL
ncbi:MAG: AAA family ATPase [Planctomycetota bacterium]|nr:MAG: AAA family ATPase [Planctomycetota bacterium]